MKDKKEFKVLLVYPNLTMMLVPSLAIGIFTNILKKEGYSVDLFDTTHYVSEENSSPQNRVKYLQAREFSDTNDLGVRIKTDLLGEFRQKVLEYQPDFLIYSVVEDCFTQTLSLMDQIKDLDIPHLVGGVYPTAAPETCISHELINCIGLGEGEHIILDMSEAVRCGKDYRRINGIWFKEHDQVIKNPRGPLVAINKGQEPDFSLFDESRFNRPMGGRIFRTIPIESYRGCPFTCTYCNSPMQVSLAREAELGNFLRTKTMNVLKDEITRTVELYDPEFLYFIDDSFTARKQSDIFDFCDMYEEFKIPFWFNTRPETCTLEMLQRLKEVGAYRISFGIESGNEQFRRKVLTRNVSNKNLKDAFDVIAQSGVAFSLNLIIGLPGETRELVMDTVEFCRTIYGFDTVTVSIFTPYAGTVLRDVAVNNNWLDKNHLTTHTTTKSQLNMPPPYLSSSDIDQLMRVMPLYIYFPKSEWPKLKRAEINDDEGNKILQYYSDIYTKDFLKQNQDDSKVWVVDGGTGCKSNPKDSFALTYNSPIRIDDDQLTMLTMQN
tara:strand:+ start:266 stop:1915 length:1650 start_codon:yes stop_codon:yes gene_type:complete